MMEEPAGAVRTGVHADRGWAGVVLAGGQSSRMGQDKALLPFEGKPLLAHAIDVLRPHTDEVIVIGDPVKYDQFGILTLADDMPGSGPLGGVLTAIRYAWYDRLIVLGCDMPRITAQLLLYLKASYQEGDHAVVPQCDGHLQPLAAIYGRGCRTVFADQLSKGDRSMAAAIERVRTRYIQVCPGEESWPEDLFRNINTPYDL